MNEPVEVSDADELVSPATGRPLTKRGSDPAQAARGRRVGVRRLADFTRHPLGEDHRACGRCSRNVDPYFDSKQTIFESLAIDLNRRVRHSMSEAMAAADNCIEAERLGFEGFFRFTAAHPALYRVVREAEFVSPETLRLHYERIVEGYRAGLRTAQQEGDIIPALDPEAAAWALMGAGELIGMRYLLWERDADGRPPEKIDPFVIDGMTRFIGNALRPHAAGEREEDNG